MRFEIQVPRQDAAEFTPSGALIFDAYATAIGVYRYILADGREVWEYRGIDEVGKPESLITIAGAALTIYHPPEFITPDNWKLYTEGMFLTPGVLDGRRVKTRVIAWSRNAIDGVMSGELSEISMGYWQRPAASIGVFEGQAYTITQTNMFYNHGSLYEAGGGRLGSSIGPTLDSRRDSSGREWRQLYAPAQVSQKSDSSKGRSMLINIGGVQVDVPDALALQVQAHLTNQDSKIQTLTKERDSAQGQAATMQALGQQQNADKTQKQEDAAFEARLKLRSDAKEVLPENYDFKGKTDRQIQLDALEAMGVKVAPEASDVTIAASFDTAVLMTQSKTDSRPASPARQLLQQIGESGRTDGRGQVEYVPPHKRADGAQTVDAMVELDRMNAYYNNPRNYAGAAGGK